MLGETEYTFGTSFLDFLSRSTEIRVTRRPTLIKVSRVEDRIVYLLLKKKKKEINNVCEEFQKNFSNERVTSLCVYSVYGRTKQRQDWICQALRASKELFLHEKLEFLKFPRTIEEMANNCLESNYRARLHFEPKTSIIVVKET